MGKFLLEQIGCDWMRASYLKQNENNKNKSNEIWNQIFDLSIASITRYKTIIFIT
jgi:hypothetical protein